MIDIKKNIMQIRPRENSGSTSSNRFDFQKNWAICKILELHQKPDDYLLTLDYYDDIIIFDSSSDPKKISFFQVKTNKSPNWTLNSLTSRKKGKTGFLNSHLGKLYDNLEKFGDAVQTLNFITNNKIKGKLKTNLKCEDTSGFCCNDLEKDALDKIIGDLKIEHSLNSLKSFENITYFKLGELSIDKHTEITKGLLVDFLDKNLPTVKYQIAPLYKSIFDEIRKKSNFEKEILNFEELKLKKSISRENFDSYITELQKTENLKDERVSIENRLNAELISFDKIKFFLKNSALYEIKKMNYNDKYLINIEKKIEKLISKNNYDFSNGLYNCMDLVFLDLINLVSPNSVIDNEMLKTIILHKLYE